MASLADQLQELIDNFIPRIRAAFLRSIQDIADTAVLAEIVRAIEAGDIEAAIRSLGVTDAAFRPLIAEVERAYEYGGVTTAESFPRKVNSGAFRFDVRNSRAEAMLRDHSSFLVRETTDSVKDGLRQSLRRGMVDGRNPMDVAIDLVGNAKLTRNPRSGLMERQRSGGIVGLTDAQENWVTNTRRDLEDVNIRIRAGETVTENHPYFARELRGKGGDRVILAASKNGKPLTVGQINQLAAQYKSNALRYRGTAIARTEAIWSLNYSEHESINQAVDAGQFRASAVRRFWDSAGNDGHTRDSHLAMEGQEVGLNEPFTFPDGTKAMFPGDRSMGAPAKETIQCRCIARTKIDFLDRARDVTTKAERDAIAALSDAELFGGRGG